MTRRQYKPRPYIYACRVCQRWYPVPTLEAQRLAKARGTCMQCEGKWRYRLELYMHIVAQHLDELVAKGKAAPEEQREVFRRLYRKRQRAYLWAKQQLEPVEVEA